MSRFSIFCRKFIVSQCRKYSQVNPFVLFFRKFPVAKKFMYKRGGEYQDIPSKIFCLTVPIIFVGEFLFFALITGTEKVWIRGGGEYQDNPWKIFCFTVPIIFVGESFTFAVFSGTGKVWIRGGGSVKIFRRKNFVSQCRKFSLGNPLLLEFFWVPEKFG